MLNISAQNRPYVGRFAPSPSGPLHFGSLVCALASYLHAKQHGGKWLLRIEDIDTPRNNPAMNHVILESLQIHGLNWDEDVIYQSQRHTLYEKALNALQIKGLIYACACSRRQIRARANTYDGHCRTRHLNAAGLAIRFKNESCNSSFTDERLGTIHINHNIATEDPVLKRADGIYAYHLAVVTDDIEQQITHIVRGNDLIETTPVHLSLYEAFDHAKPSYLHIPVVVQKAGEKLSKQHHSPCINNNEAVKNTRMALQYLGMPFNILPRTNKVNELLNWAIENWTYNMLSEQTELLILTTNDVYSAPADLFC